VSDLQGVQVASVRGIFDITNATEVARSLTAACGDGTSLVVSLDGCSHIDIEAIAVLILLHRRIGTGLVVVCEPRRVFEFTGIQRLVRVEPTIEDAVRWIKTQSIDASDEKSAAASRAESPEA
jgi:anti-anti-sigma factor